MSENENPREMSLLSKNDTNGGAAEWQSISKAMDRRRRLASGEAGYQTLPGSAPFVDVVMLADAYLAEHADDADEIISREWIEREFPEWLRFYGGVGVASILIRQEGGNRWELQVWPYFGGECVCDIRLLREGCVPPQFQLDIGSLRTRGELRRLLKMLDRRVTPETK